MGWERMVPGGKVVGWKEEGCWGKVEGRRKRRRRRRVCALWTPW